MRARPVLWFVVAAALASPAAIGLHGAQDPQQPTFRTEANYVRVDVYPSSNGAPVTDLQKDDFEILEDGAPQTLDAFEHVLVAGNVPQEDRREPASLRESRAMLENPRARVFVIFLDYYHVDVGGSHAMRDTLVNALDRLLGAEDLFAVMTPEMSARDLSFARKTTTTRGMLEKYWTWGERDQLVSSDPEDDAVPRVLRVYGIPMIAEEMIERRREKLVLDAMQDVVRSLRGAREERKAVLAISNGWRLFRPDDRLQRVQAKRADQPRLPPGRYRSAHGPDHDRRTTASLPDRPTARSATAIAWPSPGSTTLSSCATSPTKRTAPTRRSIRSIRAASPPSTSRS